MIVHLFYVLQILNSVFAEKVIITGPSTLRLKHWTCNNEGQWQSDDRPARTRHTMLLAVCMPKVTKFWRNEGLFAVENLFSFLYSAFRSEDIRALVALSF